jgi:hypothetical protein
MASDHIPAALTTRRSPTATRRGAAITMPVSGPSVAARFTVPSERSPRAENALRERHAAPPPGTTSIIAPPAPPPAPRPWSLPPRGLALFYGRPEAPRLFHYFLPRLLAEGKQVLCLDGANRFDPLLIARLARQRGIAPSEYNRAIRVARAFTCFQLTELLARVPRLLQNFPADALIVTALPDLYFDQDIRERAAAVTFAHALAALRALAPLPLAVAVFSDATSFAPPPPAGCGLHLEPTRKNGCGLRLEPTRKNGCGLRLEPTGKKSGLYLEPTRKMFAQLAAQSAELWRFTLDAKTDRLRLVGEKREAMLLSGNRE